ncbi:type I-E CRISPR-associated protein Cas6/Cse3/CasE [Sediminivirga luteola]|uniref:Type I-E CRISPR-associated protein Cas6/Cse3/CasE n=1 Tax=Sediminivirga luteola TaxID=1774748 RepID=A0A8J2XMP4_9MICO|nr:type I-E CRISPR-associated protein Cas6/Cse3/CasE [Sediminivirga luteola]GGA28508.1 hypothetical protein GCM10011333_34050 [Sediminivirga luteola]
MVRDLIAHNAEKGHAFVMTAFRDGLGPHPRSEVKALWRLESEKAQLIVQSASAPERPELLGAVIDMSPAFVPARGDRVEVRISLSCLKTPPSDIPVELRSTLKSVPKKTGKGGRCYRSKQVLVPEEERSAWARRRLERVGLDVDYETLTISRVRYASLGGPRKGIPFVDLRAEAMVTDGAEVEKAVVSGVGRGKNYGLGLLRLRHLP